jgi:hypothetical protein
MMQQPAKAGLIVLALGCAITGARAGQEIYLANGGKQFLVLEQPRLGQPSISATNMASFNTESFTAERNGDSLKLIENGAPIEGSKPSVITMNFRRSPTQPRDYVFTGQRYSWETIELPKITQPLPMLHRVDDENVVRYFRGAEDLPEGNTTETTDTLLALARQMAEAHPDDLYFRVLVFDALLRQGDLAGMQRVRGEVRRNAG